MKLGYLAQKIKPGSLISFDTVVLSNTKKGSKTVSIQLPSFRDAYNYSQGNYASVQIGKVQLLKARLHDVGDVIKDPNGTGNFTVMSKPADGCIMAQSTDPSRGVVLLKSSDHWVDWERVTDGTACRFMKGDKVRVTVEMIQSNNGYSVQMNHIALGSFSQAVRLDPEKLANLLVTDPPAGKGDKIAHPETKETFVIMSETVDGCVIAQSTDPSKAVMLLKPEDNWLKWKIVK